MTALPHHYDLKAVHDFLRYHTQEQAAGDRLTVQR